jgi:hypothetical protein
MEFQKGVSTVPETAERGEHGVQKIGERGVPERGEHGVPEMGEHGVPERGEHEVPLLDSCLLFSGFSLLTPSQNPRLLAPGVAQGNSSDLCGRSRSVICSLPSALFHVVAPL